MTTKKGKPRKFVLNAGSNIDHQLQQLPASKELVAHYRDKLSVLNREYDELSARVDDCKSLFEVDSKVQQELVRRNNEVSRLQQAISDLQVYIFEEREQALKLYAENDNLKLQHLEDRKKIDLLLSLAGTTEEEVTFFISQPSKHAGIIPQHKKAEKLKKSASEPKSATQDKSVVDPEILTLKVQALQAQLQEQERLYRDETVALLQDRELVRQERAAELARYEKNLEDLTVRLQQSQEKVCGLTSVLVKAKHDHRGYEAGWISERDQLMKNLNLCKEQLGEVFSNNTTVLRGTGLPAGKVCGELSVLKDQLNERDRMLVMYQEQCAAMEQEVTRMRDQAESVKNQFKDRVQKMAAQVTYLRNKYNELDRRRVLEAEGFRSDIRLMRNRLRDLERGFQKVNSRSTVSTANSQNIAGSYSANIISKSRDTVERARQLEQELRHIHSRVMSLETELKNSASD